MKPLEVKGQGVIEGVMMRNNDRYVLAMRKENKEIGFIHEDCSDRGDKIPILRGISAFFGEIIFGIKAITSASDYREEHSKNKTTAMEKLFNKLFGRTGDEMFMGIVVLLSVAMSVGVFIILPYKGGEYFAQTYFRNRPIVRMGIEAIFRAVVFLIYLIYLST